MSTTKPDVVEPAADPVAADAPIAEPADAGLVARMREELAELKILLLGSGSGAPAAGGGAPAAVSSPPASTPTKTVEEIVKDVLSREDRDAFMLRLSDELAELKAAQVARAASEKAPKKRTFADMLVGVKW